MKVNSFISALSIEGVDELKVDYAAFDVLMQKQIDENHYRCIEGCGACCNTPCHHIEASIFEMIPMALELMRIGKAEEFYELLDQMDTANSVCIIYKPLSEDGCQGHCTMHDQRPLICRVFGGGNRTSRSGEHELLLCRYLKDYYKDKPEIILNVSKEFPVISEYCSSIRDHNPNLSQQLMPINEALKQALDLLLTKWFYASQVEEGE